MKSASPFQQAQRSGPSPTPPKRANKRRKLNDSFIADQPIIPVTLEVGQTSRSFNIHKNLLCSHSLHFRAILESEDKATSLVLRDVIIESFETFSRWIYNNEVLAVDELADDDEDDDDDSENDGSDSSDEGEDGGDDNSGDTPNANKDDTHGGLALDLAVEKVGETGGSDSSSTVVSNGKESGLDTPWYSGLNRKGRVFGRLLNLYIFATTYQAASFKRAIVLRWQRFTFNTKTMPCPTVVKHALDTLGIKSSLCQFLIVCYGYYTDHKAVDKTRFATLSAEFLTEVLVITFERVNDDDDVVKTDEDWCEYHEHEDEGERKECEKSRKEDPDIAVQKPSPPRRMRGCC